MIFLWIKMKFLRNIMIFLRVNINHNDIFKDYNDIFKDYNDMTETEVHAELVYAECLLLKVKLKQTWILFLL